MTPIGHTFTGLAIGYCVIPREMRGKQKTVTLGVFTILASAPDLPFPYWGHFRYDISHSLIVTAVATTVIALFLAVKYKGQSPFTPKMLLGGVLAWYSHILLDMFYNHAIGLHITWPFREYRVALPIPWLSTGDKMDIFSMHNVKVALFEVLTFGPLLLLAVLFKKCFVPMQQTNEAISQA